MARATARAMARVADSQILRWPITKDLHQQKVPEYPIVARLRQCVQASLQSWSAWPLR